MKARSYLSIFLVLLLLLCQISCAPQGQGDETTEPPSQIADTEAISETSCEDAEGEVTLYSDGKWQYRTVTRAVRNTGEKDFSFGLTGVLSDLFGSAPHSANDTAIKGEDVCEMIIGYTAHPQMRSIYAGLSYGQAAVRVLGNKIYVAAYTQEGFTALLSHVEALIKRSYSGGELSLKIGELETFINVNEELNTLPTLEDAEFLDYYDCGLGQTMLVLSGGSIDAFENYVKKFDAGSCVSTVYESGNAFATFDLGDELINVSFAKNDKRLRIIRNKDTEPTSLFAEPTETTNICEPLIIMHGLGWEKGKDNGLCIVIRLSDGRFIVVDGGFNRQRDADELYKLLKDNTPAGMEPTVAAWFITHGHSDHHGTFATLFCARYKASVNVENVMFNPPENKLFVGTVSNPTSSAINARITMLNAIKAFKAHHVRSHIGDRYYIGDAVVDVLYSIDYQYPTTFDYYNTSSLIFSIKLAGQRIIITGDASNESFKRAVEMYGADLKCDIVQVAHHGYTTGVSASASTSVIQGYRYMSPSLVLWPISADGYEVVRNDTYNVALSSLPSVKRILVARDDDHVIQLPFSAS